MSANQTFEALAGRGPAAKVRRLGFGAHDQQAQPGAVLLPGSRGKGVGQTPDGHRPKHQFGHE